jgi:AcrR family transcriptional regulator
VKRPVRFAAEVGAVLTARSPPEACSRKYGSEFGESSCTALAKKQTGLYIVGVDKTRVNKSNARQRIVETAERLFYAEGVRAVGIDRIIAEAEVAKMSLYNHFSSKDDLILAVLRYREEKFGGMFAKWMDRHVSKRMDRLGAFFAALKDWFESPGFRGCMFINARVELADAKHPASEFSACHKERFHQMLRSIIEESEGVKSAETMAPAIALLVEGAIVTAVMTQSSESADVARDAALALVAKARRE